jgi:hypothetical protein
MQACSWTVANEVTEGHQNEVGYSDTRKGTGLHVFVFTFVRQVNLHWNIHYLE